MSSPTERGFDWVGLAALLVCLGATAWYASHQLVYSLLFFYQVFQYAFLP